MRLVKRYRRANITKATKPWSPLFVLDEDEITTILQGRWSR